MQRALVWFLHSGVSSVLNSPIVKTSAVSSLSIYAATLQLQGAKVMKRGRYKEVWCD